MTVRFAHMLTTTCTILVLGAMLLGGWPAAAHGQGHAFHSSFLPTPPPAHRPLRSGIGTTGIGATAEARRLADENRRREAEQRYLIEMHEHQEQMQRRIQELERLQRENERRETQRHFQEMQAQRELSEQRRRRQRELQQQQFPTVSQSMPTGEMDSGAAAPLHPLEVRRQNQQLVREARAQGRRLTPAEQAEARQRYADAVLAFRNR